jgi:hypothetical protein
MICASISVVEAHPHSMSDSTPLVWVRCLPRDGDADAHCNR